MYVYQTHYVQPLTWRDNCGTAVAMSDGDMLYVYHLIHPSLTDTETLHQFYNVCSTAETLRRVLVPGPRRAIDMYPLPDTGLTQAGPPYTSGPQKLYTTTPELDHQGFPTSDTGRPNSASEWNGVGPSTSSQPYQPVQLRDLLRRPGNAFKNSATLDGFNCASDGLAAAQAAGDDQVRKYNDFKNSLGAWEDLLPKRFGMSDRQAHLYNTPGGQLPDGTPVDLHKVPGSEFDPAMWGTGSIDHVVAPIPRTRLLNQPRVSKSL